MNSPKEARRVIGSYVDARAAWPWQDRLAASSEPGWPRRADGWEEGPRPRSLLWRPFALGWTAPWPGPEVTAGCLVLRQGGGGSGPSTPPLRTLLGWKDRKRGGICNNDQHGRFVFMCLFCHFIGYFNNPQEPNSAKVTRIEMWIFRRTDFCVLSISLHDIESQSSLVYM